MMRSPFRNVRKEDPSPGPKTAVKLEQKIPLGFMKISVLEPEPDNDPMFLGLLDPDQQANK
jgi:hypothetical protein